MIKDPYSFPYEKLPFCRLLAAAGVVTVEHGLVLRRQMDTDSMTIRVLHFDADAQGEDVEGHEVEYVFGHASMAEAVIVNNEARLRDDDGAPCVVRFFRTTPLTEVDLLT